MGSRGGFKRLPYDPRIMSTVEWLRDSLQMVNGHAPIIRCGRTWTPIAGFSSVGCIFTIYKDTHNYCVHADDTWPEDGVPNMGYFDINLSWDDLLITIAKRYDDIKSTTHQES
jgi:hypothetical protein